MNQCCVSIQVRGPQHLMESVGHLLPHGWSVIFLTSDDEIIEIKTEAFDLILTEKRVTNYVLCVFRENLKIDPTEVAEIPSSEYLRDIILFNDTHWRSALCTSETCCPRDGKSYGSALLTCEAINLWQEALADWIINLSTPDEDLLHSLSNLDVRDWLLSRSIAATSIDWREFLEKLVSQYPSVALHTILAGFYYVSSNNEALTIHLMKARELDENYQLLQLLQRGLDSSMPSHILIKSLERFETRKKEIHCLNKVSLSPKASPPAATRTGER